MHRLLLAGMLLVCGIHSAWAVEISDYAYQARIGESHSAGKLQRIELPLAVMLATTSPNLDDLAVFNASGKRLPHTLLRTPDSYREHLIELPFHRFDRFLEQRNKTITTREQNRQQDAIHERQTTETIAVQSVRADYLIELEPDGEHRDFSSLELKWQHEPASQLLDLRVEVGNDIDHLRILSAQSSLSNSAAGEQEWRRIRTIPSHNRYLRLTPLAGVTRFELKHVDGHYQEKVPATRLIYGLEPELISEGKQQYYFFRLPSVHTAEGMRFIPAESHGIISGDLYISHRSEPDVRRLVERGFRQHNITDEEIKPSRPFDMTRMNPYAVWFDVSGKPTIAPRVELSYAQQELIFLADGNGPYRLAWGQAGSQTTTVNLGEILAIDLNDPAQRGELVTLAASEIAGGPDRLKTRTELPWKKWLLWAMLVLAVLVTGRMALGLYREMKR